MLGEIMHFLRNMWMSVILIICAANLYANPLNPQQAQKPLADYEGEPSAYVHNCVNVITGQYCETGVDLVVHHSSDPLVLERIFLGSTEQHGMLGQGWTTNFHHGLSAYFRDLSRDHQYNFCLMDSGSDLYFEGKPEKKQKQLSPIGITPGTLTRGVTNTASGFISGQTNIKNLSIYSLEDRDNLKVRSGNGSIKNFTLESDVNGFRNYKLLSERRSNGNFISYTHPTLNKGGSVALMNSSKMLGGISTPMAWKGKSPTTKEYKTNDGRWVRYHYNQYDNGQDLLLDKVESSNAPTISYGFGQHGRLINENTILVYYKIYEKKLPENRFLNIEYHRYQAPPPEINSPGFSGPDPSAYAERVKCLKAPAGHDATPVTIYNFDYELYTVIPKLVSPDGKPMYDWGGFTKKRMLLHGNCTVTDALGFKTKYTFDRGLRLSTIERQNENSYICEKLFWGQQLSKNDTHLLARTLLCNQKTVFSRTYQYDSAGNVLQETLAGNLSGHNVTPPQLDDNGNGVANGCEVYTKSKVYSNDGFNLLLKESDGFQTTIYQYYPGTNLLKAKFLGTNTERQRRWYYFYNDIAELIKEITDDGSSDNPENLTGVKERHITHYTLTNTHPRGMPQTIEQKYLDLETRQEHLIHKTVNTYTNLAKISKQDHYDSQGEYAYSLYWEYDARGNVVKETDALGQVTTRNYDENNNCIFEQGPNPAFHKTFTYDFMNRLIKEEEIHPDGVFTQSHCYDLMGNRIATVDVYGNETTFEYNSFGKVVKTILPTITSDSGKIYNPVIANTYDAMGALSQVVDARGVETKRSYTIRGQVASVTHPDGRIEKKVYQTNGALKETIDCNGTVTRFTYDCQNRPTKIETLSASGVLLTTSTATYTGFHVLSETDPVGVVTNYSYFSDGKLKSKQKGDSLTNYAYDTHGRLIKTTEHYGQNSSDVVIKASSYDLLNRVVDESVQDSQGTILTRTSYTYGIEGKVTKTTSYNTTGSSTVTVEYNSHGIPTVVTDAEGNKTTTLCRYDYFNKLGQRVPSKEITDPLGNVEITISDALGRIVTKTRKNAFGNLTQQQDIAYDANGNVVQVTDQVIAHAEDVQQIITQMHYDTCNRLVAVYEALGTPEQKQTKFTYDNFGQKKEIIKSDGVTLSHTYDTLGRLETLQSSDHTISYFYKYDLKGNFIHCEDCISGAISSRKFDANDHIERETLSHGLSVDYSYDRLGRATHVKLHDGTAIRYTFDALFLRAVDRIDHAGKVQYTHQYEFYDQSGKILKSQLAGRAGTLDYTYTNSGRLINTHHTLWNEVIDQYDSVGNILKKTISVEQQPTELNFEYDALNQLTKEKGHTYTYDSHYNQRSKDGITRQFNALNQLIDDGHYRYTYDLNGNLKEKISDTEKVTYEYDALDRLITVSKKSEKHLYAYDSMNRRLTKTHCEHAQDGTWSPINEIKYLYQGQNEIGATDKDGKIIELRLIGTGKGAEIGAAIAIEIGSKMYVPLHNHTGSVACILDGLTGEIAESYQYSAFGTEEFESAIIPWRYSSKRIDNETGFVYFGRRYYSPEISRWITPDPIGKDGGPNLYAYVHNNAVCGIDLYGLLGFWDTLCNGINSLCKGAGQAVNRISQGLNRVSNAFNFATYGLANLWKKEFPIPILRDGFSAIHHLCNYGTLNGYKMEYQGEHSSHGERIGLWNDSKHVACTTGIESDVNSTNGIADIISQAHGDSHVHAHYNSSHGLFWDLCETVCQKLNIHTHCVGECVEMVRDIFSKMGPNGRLRLFGHSQGGQIIDCLRYYLPKEMLKRIDVVTLGSAKMISNNDFGSAINYVNVRDCVPFIADPIGIIRSFFCNDINISFLNCGGIPFIDHAFTSNAYQQALKYEGAKFQASFRN